MIMQNQYEQQLISMIIDTRKKMKTNRYLEEALKNLLTTRMNLVNKLEQNKNQIEIIIHYLLKMNKNLKNAHIQKTDDLADIKIARNKKEMDYLDNMRKNLSERINNLNI
jgi:hypothetical protein